ncbi:MAG: diguanylate cyclase domain-containing protein [Spirulina sp.]
MSFPLPSSWRSWPLARLAQTIGVALGFALLFMVSVNLASLPGKITAIWLPAALTLVVLLRYGRGILPGVFGGALAIVMVGLWDTGLSWPSLIWASLVFACCETLQPLLAVWYLGQLYRLLSPQQRGATHPLPPQAWFETVPRVFSFIVAAVASPTLPALAGSWTWQTVGLIEPSTLALTWFTWWIPAAMAHLIFAPPLLLLCRPQRPHPLRLGRADSWATHTLQEAIGLWCAFMLLLYLTFGRGYLIDYMFLPLLMLAVFRLGLFSASLSLAIITLAAIYATNLGFGVFVREAPHESFIYLQSFLAVLSLTILILSAVIAERRTSQNRLQEILTSLENQVEKRTAELRKNENILTGLFAASPIGLGILDDSLRFVRMNPTLANVGFSAEQSLLEMATLLPELSSAIQWAYQTVARTQSALIDQEVATTSPDVDIQRTWLLSCFPIQGKDPISSQVGVVLLEISDRKRLEAALQKQADLDALTQLANRRAFDRHLQREWSHGLRAQQPLSLIMADVDYFKAYNDHYGHPMGDQCLVQVAQVIQHSARRPGDLAVRYGGEEFALLLPNTPLDAACQIALAMQNRLRQLGLVHAGSAVSPYVTLSLGLVTHIPKAGELPQRLIGTADQALYTAKRQGRNRLVAREL